VLHAQTLLFIIASILYAICVYYIPQLRKELAVSFFTYIILLATLLTQDWLFQAMQDLSKVAILNFASKLLFIIIVILIVKRQSDYIWYAFALSAVQLLIALASFIWSVKRYRLKLHKPNISNAIKLLADEKSYFFSLIVISVYTTTNTVILGFFTSSQNIGYFTAGQKIIIIIQAIMVLPLRQALFPHMSKLIAVDVDKGIALTQKLFPLIFLVTFLTGVFTVVFAKYIIFYLYGREFSPAVIVLQILAFVPMLITLSNVWGLTVMMNLKLDKVFFRITVLNAIIGFASNVLFIKHFSYIGSAMAWLLTEAFCLAAIFIYLSKLKLKLINFRYFAPQYFINELYNYRNKTSNH